MLERRFGLCALSLATLCSIAAEPFARIEDEAPASPVAVSSSPSMERPRFDESGALTRPSDPRGWRFVGTSYGLGYSERTSPGPQTFKNIYMQAEAYRAFVEKGEFPDQTMFAMLIYDAAQAEEPRRAGYYQGELAALEIAVKDRQRFDTGWAYFDFGEGGAADRAKPFPQDSGCNTCHAEHGHDNVFTQFYPELRRRLAQPHVAGSEAPGDGS